MATLVLIGPISAGKTTFLNSARNKKTPEKNLPTVLAYDTFSWGVKIGGISGKICDTSGSTTLVLNKKEVLKKLMSDNNRIAFIFNGRDFLYEVEHPKEPGEISSIIKNLVLPTWEEELDRLKNNQKKLANKQLFFIANVSNNPNDEKFYVGVNNVKERIVTAMGAANKYYSDIAKHFRYPFINYFESNSFFCIDARDFKAVQDAGNEMLK